VEANITPRHSDKTRAPAPDGAPCDPFAERAAFLPDLGIGPSDVVRLGFPADVSARLAEALTRLGGAW
jgi:hypothetical protein